MYCMLSEVCILIGISALLLTWRWIGNVVCDTGATMQSYIRVDFQISQHGPVLTELQSKTNGVWFSNACMSP